MVFTMRVRGRWGLLSLVVVAALFAGLVGAVPAGTHTHERQKHHLPQGHHTAARIQPPSHKAGVEHHHALKEEVAEVAGEEMPQTDEEMPQTDEEMPQTDEEMPQTDEEMPQTDEEQQPQTDEEEVLKLPRTMRGDTMEEVVQAPARDTNAEMADDVEEMVDAAEAAGEDAQEAVIDDAEEIVDDAEEIVDDAFDQGKDQDADDEDEDDDDEEEEDYTFEYSEDEDDTDLVRNLKTKLAFMKKEHELDTKFQKELVQRLREIQGELKKYSSQVKDPQASDWILRRTEGLGSFLASPRIGRALEDNLKKLMKRTQRLEKALDADLTSVVGTEYSEPLARFMTFLLVALPVSIVVYGIYRSYVVFSVRQYVLVGHLSNLIFVLSSLILFCTLGRDPFGALIAAQHEVGVVLTQLWLALQYFFMLVLLVFALLASKTKYQRGCFLAQLVLLGVVGLDYRYRIYKPVLHGGTVHSNGVIGFLAYLFYTVAVAAMIVITVKTAKVSRNEFLVREVDAVIGLFTCTHDPTTDVSANHESSEKEV